MALPQPPYVLASASHGAELFRDALQVPFANGGVVGTTDLLVRQMTTPAMKVQVAEGQFIIAGTLGATGPFPSGLTQQGAYYDYNNATDDLTIAAADPTNPRIDTVCVSVQDAQYAGSNNQAVPQVVTGTPTPGATLTNLSGAGATPASSIVLAHVLVPANATSIVTADLRDARPFVALGNPLRGVPAGRVVATADVTVAAGQEKQITPMVATGVLRGGVTVATNGLKVPVSGSYLVTAKLYGNLASNGLVTNTIGTDIVVGGTVWEQVTPGGSSFGGFGFADILTLSAESVVLLRAHNIGGAGTGTVYFTPGHGAAKPSTLAVALLTQ